MKPGPKTEPASARDGDPLLDGDEERDPGGVRVEAYREAVEGLGRRKGRLASDCERGSASTGWRVLGSLMVEAAIGKDCIESVGESWFGDCMKKTITVLAVEPEESGCCRSRGGGIICSS